MQASKHPHDHESIVTIRGVPSGVTRSKNTLARSEMKCLVLGIMLRQSLPDAGFSRRGLYLSGCIFRLRFVQVAGWLHGCSPPCRPVGGRMRRCQAWPPSVPSVEPILVTEVNGRKASSCAVHAVAILAALLASFLGICYPIFRSLSGAWSSILHRYSASVASYRPLDPFQNGARTKRLA